jgi:CHASE2 domain-containing sensor protein
VGVDLWAERNSQIENCVPLEERGSVNTPMRAFLPSPFRPHSRYTAIVSLKPEVEPNEIFHDGCQLKEYLAKLVGRIDSEGPALIVTDIYIPGGTCGKPDRATSALQNAIKEGHGKTVLGLKTEFLDYSERPESEPSSTCLVLAENWTFDDPDVETGLMKLNRNFYRIPLEWSILLDRNSALHREPVRGYGVAGVAADVYSGGSYGILAAESGAMLSSQIPGITNILTKGVHPFTGELIPPRDFPVFSASDLVQDPKRLDVLRGRIVIIGDFSATYRRQEVEWPGPVLQANYIEALLDGRFYTPVPYVDFSLFYVASLGIIQWAFWKSKSPERTAAIFLFLVVAANYLLPAIHVFLTVWKGSVSAVAIVIKWVEARGHITAHE